MQHEKTIQLLLQLLQDPKPTQEEEHWLAEMQIEQWQHLVKVAVNQQVAPLLYNQLRQHNRLESAPTAIEQTLKQHYYQQGLHNMRLYRDLKVVLTALHAEQIPVIVLKGAFLAAEVYDQIALRAMNDIDLLVEPEQLFKAAEIVQGLGYQPLTPIMPALETSYHHHLPRFMRAGACSLELHWTITRPQQTYTIDERSLWQWAKPTVLAGTETLALAPIDLLLHLCLHATYQHLFNQGMRFLCDINAVLQRYQHELEWDRFIARAEAFGWQRGVYLSLYLAHDLMQAPVPPAVLAKLQPIDLDAQLLAFAQAQIFPEDRSGRIESRNLARFWQSPSRIEQASLLYQVYFPPRAIIAKQYGYAPTSPKIYLAYARRIADVLKRNLPFAWQLLLPKSALVNATKEKYTLLTWLEAK